MLALLGTASYYCEAIVFSHGSRCGGGGCSCVLISLGANGNAWGGWSGAMGSAWALRGEMGSPKAPQPHTLPPAPGFLPSTSYSLPTIPYPQYPAPNSLPPTRHGAIDG